MKKQRTYFALGLGLKYLVVIIAVFFAFVILSSLVDVAVERSTRFNCWKLEQYASTYEAFWITEDENVACRSVDIIIDAEVRTENK